MEGVVPQIWKEAHIVPIHKKGLKSNIENYRPISILNTLSKVQEKIVYNHIYPYICNLIPQQQHGFMKRRSAVTNLAIFTSDVLKYMDNRSQVDVIYTDFEKAFDRVDHIILLRKLLALGINGDLYRWFKSYITNRSQAVIIGSSKSNFINIKSGVPQGSLLGPLLYTLYIYDIGECIRHAKFLLYADDTKIYKNVRTSKDCYLLQEDLDRLNEYYIKNRITVNVNKCLHITFTRNKNAVNAVYRMNNKQIDEAMSVRDLGVILDKKLTFSEHFNTMINKAYKNLGFIMRTSKSFRDIHTIKLLYFSYVRSVLEYCSTIWNPQYITYIRMLERIQRKFIHYLDYRTKNPFVDYISSCNQYHITTLEDRRTAADMMLLHDICSGVLDCPDVTSEIVQLSVPCRRTRHTNLFHVSQRKSNYSKNSVASRLPRLYNKRFEDVDPFCTSRSKFKQTVQTILHLQHTIPTQTC